MVVEEGGFHAAADGGEEQGESSNKSMNLPTGSYNDRHYQGEDRNRNVSVYREQINDVLHVHPNDHPGMALTTDLLNGKNFHSWSRAIRRGLAAKNKMDFIDEYVIEPNVNSVDYKQWLRVDYLVFSWIVNSISKELGRGFQHIETSKELWAELRRRFDRTNGPKIYKLRREIATYSQGNQSVLMYYNSLQSLWDELHLLVPCQICTCGAAEANKHNEENEKLMQFLMGLNDTYESIRNQILILDPLPTVSNAYSMVLQVEDQKDITTNFPEKCEQNALYSNQRNYTNRVEGYKRRLSREEKQKLKCAHCGGNGHENAGCFELTGVPDWYKKIKAERGRFRAHCVEEEEDLSIRDDTSSHHSDSTMEMNKMIQAEVAKYLSTYLQKSNNAGLSPDAANLVDISSKDDNNLEYMGHFAFGLMQDIQKNEWILDSGASIHMCCNANLMHTLRKLDEPQKIYLPDGSSIIAHYTGEVQLTDEIVLQRVLFAPSFTHNLISVGELTKDLIGKVLFLPTHCIIQRQDQEQALGIGKLKGKLYVIQHAASEIACSNQSSTNYDLKALA